MITRRVTQVRAVHSALEMLSSCTGADKGRFVAASLALLMATTLGCSTGAPPATPSPTPAKTGANVQRFTVARVLNVIDGVSIDVELDNQVVRVRYLGVEVPEAGPPGADGASLAESALQFNRFLVEARTVELEKEDDVEADEFGRSLRYVYVGGEMVNLALLTNGYGTVASSPPNFKHRTSFAIAEERAKRGRRGIWERASDSGQDDGLSGSEPPPFSGGTLPVPPDFRSGAITCDFTGTDEPAIKGNVDPRTGARIYHVPGSFFYATTVVSEGDGDRWFCTEGEAISAGWKKSAR